MEDRISRVEEAITTINHELGVIMGNLTWIKALLILAVAGIVELVFDLF